MEIIIQSTTFYNISSYNICDSMRKGIIALLFVLMLLLPTISVVADENDLKITEVRSLTREEFRCRGLIFKHGTRGTFMVHWQNNGDTDVENVVLSYQITPKIKLLLRQAGSIKRFGDPYYFETGGSFTMNAGWDHDTSCGTIYGYGLFDLKVMLGTIDNKEISTKTVHVLKLPLMKMLIWE